MSYIGFNALGMEPFDRRLSAGEPLAPSQQTSRRTGEGQSSSRTRTPKAYRGCDILTGTLLCWMVVFTPWAFGTTQPWSIWTMNITGFVLGAILIGKWLIRHQTGFRPSRWGREAEPEDDLFSITSSRPDALTIGLAVLTVLTLGYVLVSALNARAIYVEWERRFEYKDCIQWLPHSYDRASTWHAFWRYLGLACVFWAARDWILGRSGKQRRRSRREDGERTHPVLASQSVPKSGSNIGMRGPSEATLTAAVGRSESQLPPRLRLLLWILCINGSILALESILQRLSGTDKLLWLVLPRFNRIGTSQFGPYAYRANAATYFNLVWPVCLAFWLLLRSSARGSLRSGHRLGSGNHIVLLPGAVLMAACPIISTSRGGALIAVGSILITMALLLWVARKESVWFRLGTCSLFAVILGFSAFLGLKQLVPRFQTIFTDQMSRRTEIYDNALPIAREFPVLGTGPGSFGALYQLYRSPDQVWAAYVHDDWLETRITFGWVGLSMILLMLGIKTARWFIGGGISAPWELTAMIWVALGGCLLHGKFDFPFQIYSIVFLFVLLSAMLFCLSRAHQRA